MGLLSSLRRASASTVPLSLRYWRASRPPIPPFEAPCLSGGVPFVRFSTVPNDAELLQHVQPYFGTPNPNALSLPDGLPFLIETGLGITWGNGVDEIVIPYHGHLFPKMLGFVIFERGPSIEFRMHWMLGDEIHFDMIRISDECSRHVGGSEKFLETIGIKPSTIRILFDYLENRVIPSEDEFPFEMRNGDERGTLTLRRKCEEEIVIVEVRAIGQDGILDQLAEHDCFDDERGLDWHGQYDLDEFMPIFDEDEEGVGNEEKIGDIACLFMTARVYFGKWFGKRIKLYAFAFPDKIAVPEIILSDHAGSGLEPLYTSFKERGIHRGTMKFWKNYLNHHCITKPDCESVPKIFGRFDGSQMKAAQCQARRRLVPMADQ